MTDLEVRDLTVEYPSGDYVIRPLDGLSFQARSSDLCLVLGPSGSGKTTLLSCLAGILSPTGGEILVDGADVTRLAGRHLDEYRSRRVGIVFQAFNLVPSLTARENVEVPLLLSGAARREARRRAEALLDRVALADRADHRPGKLSGGQQQRVAIARALAHDPPVLLADEPTAHLDHIQVEHVLRILRDLAAPGRLVIVVTHDDRITPLADRVVNLVPEVVAEERREPERRTLAPDEVLFEQGDPSDLIYVLEEGGLELYRMRGDGSREVLRVVEPGGYFGELGPLLRLPRSASARATEAATVTGYTLGAFRERFGWPPGRP